MSRIMHFEIHAENPARAIAFYTELLDWKFSQWGDQKYWLIATGDKSAPGIDGGLLPRPFGGGPQDGAHVNAFVCTVDVDNLADGLDRAIKDGIHMIATLGTFGQVWNLLWEEWQDYVVAAVQAV